MKQFHKPKCLVCGVEGDCSKGTMNLIQWTKNLDGCAAFGIYLCNDHYQELKELLKT